MAIKYSALNLVPIREGDDERTAINDMVKLAQHLDELSYERYWIAEHHNAPNLVSSATALLIQHTLEHTKHIRVGSGGIMLPNHAPLIVAENDDEAQYLASSMAQVMVSITRGRMQPVQPPTHDLQNILTPREYAMAMERQKISLIGSENTVQQKIQDFMETYGEVNEIMAISYIYDKDMQLDSYRRFKNVINQINEKNTL